MNAQLDSSGYSSLDKTKLWLAVLLAVAGLVGYYWLEDRQGLWTRVGVLLGAVLLAVLLVWFSTYGAYLREFFVESQFELRKIVWPTRQESTQTTLVVAVVVVVISLLLFAFDSVLGLFFSNLFGAGR